MGRASLDRWFLALAALVFATMLLGNLSHPLLWQDEAETVMYGTCILEYGYPKVHGERNVVYEFGTSIAQGIKEDVDAFIGTTWGDFYFAVPGILWARGHDDLYARTLRLRLPFALAGALGVGLFAGAVAPALGAGRARRAFTASLLLLSALSISLVLHLREVRYYPLLVLVGGAILYVHLRRYVYGTLGARAHAVATALLLLALFNLFFAAYFSFALLLALDRVRAARAEPGGRPLLRELAPLLASALLVLPLVIFFETFEIAAEFTRDLALTPTLYASNLGWALVHLARHELLVPALLCEAALRIDDSRAPAASAGVERRVARFLAFFALGYAALACLNPLVYERYFVVLSPVLTALFVLDAFVLVRRAPVRARRGATGGLVALALAACAVRAPEIRGRFEEIARPYQGPLDFAIAHLRQTYPHPEALVIATNYEAQAYMYYLGSRVIVGLSLNNIERERKLEPDVVIPRRRWPRSLREIRGFLARGGYRAEPLPVMDLYYNNVPALSASRWVPDPHRFRTPRPSRDGERLVVYHRDAAAVVGRTEAR